MVPKSCLRNVLRNENETINVFNMFLGFFVDSIYIRDFLRTSMKRSSITTLPRPFVPPFRRHVTFSRSTTGHNCKTTIYTDKHVQVQQDSEKAKRPMVTLKERQRSTAHVGKSVDRITSSRTLNKSDLYGRVARLLEENYKKNLENKADSESEKFYLQFDTSYVRGHREHVKEGALVS
ncbi:hypothetical protein ATANTOWER_015134 [Ataeniobius toweri]|uniref:Uncharacterized protein n=1 Tax=Ataeniobius toweri TaxID=208326 RepID=A0ABU7AXY4_9TELE|nr:hypothetical protein [Ataeniobius toweri]